MVGVLLDDDLVVLVCQDRIKLDLYVVEYMCENFMFFGYVIILVFNVYVIGDGMIFFVLQVGYIELIM